MGFQRNIWQGLKLLQKETDNCKSGEPEKTKSSPEKEIGSYRRSKAETWTVNLTNTSPPTLRSRQYWIKTVSRKVWFPHLAHSRWPTKPVTGLPLFSCPRRTGLPELGPVPSNLTLLDLTLHLQIQHSPPHRAKFPLIRSNGCNFAAVHSGWWLNPTPINWTLRVPPRNPEIPQLTTRQNNDSHSFFTYFRRGRNFRFGERASRRATVNNWHLQTSSFRTWDFLVPILEPQPHRWQSLHIAVVREWNRSLLSSFYNTQTYSQRLSPQPTHQQSKPLNHEKPHYLEQRDR